MDQIILDQVNLLISYIDQLRLKYKITQIYNVSIIEIIDYMNDQYKVQIKINPSIYLSSYIISNLNEFNSILTNLFNSLDNINIINIETIISNEDIIINVILKVISIFNMPEEMIFHTLINLSYNEIKLFCLVSKEANNVCKSDLFWLQKIKLENNERNEIIPFIKGKMEQMYINYNTLWGFGSDEFGQLGLDDNNDNKKISIKIPFDYKVKSVSCGGLYTIIIDENDDLWSFGFNYNGQLGLDHNIDRKIPTKIEFNYKVKSVSCGDNHTIIIDENNDLWSFGSNKSGQLGLGDNEDRDKPKKLQFNYKVKSVSCGQNHTIIIDENDELWSFGSNKYGQLGLNDYKNRNIPIKILFNYNVKSISCGLIHTIIIDENDKLWSFGRNLYGQLGLGDNDNRNKPTKIPFNYKVKSVSCGNYYTIIIDENNDLWSFGRNIYGQLGLGDHTYNIDMPIKIPFTYKVKSVSCGGVHTIIMDENNEL
uniref:F-box and regulator of chromosome condensation repeat protein n=1 Tax=Pithovirus LCPAC102 TaxID=2506587 RepID=A0A4D5XF94_9VIRU|nr:MAG: F-box and regulator of chromosome condensation repeat protein [Pithovirus LCPAC102]